jgi:hypothetical protein
MPLKKVRKDAHIKARKAVAKQNIEKLIAEGRDPKQAVAIAYSEAKIPKRKKKTK